MAAGVGMRAPWRWRWGAILELLLRAGAWTLAIWWAPVLGIALAVWLVLQVRATYTQPLPSPTRGDVYEAVTSHNIEKRYNDAQTTFTPDAISTSG